LFPVKLLKTLAKPLVDLDSGVWAASPMAGDIGVRVSGSGVVSSSAFPKYRWSVSISPYVFASDDLGEGVCERGRGGAGCGESRLASITSSLTIEEGASLVRFGLIGWRLLWGSPRLMYTHRCA